MNNSGAITGLRKLADFLEQNPEFPYVGTIISARMKDKEELKKYVRALGHTKKNDFGEILSLSHEFTPEIRLDLDIARALVCRKEVIGTKTIPAKPATPEITVEDYKWVCDEPILAD